MPIPDFQTVTLPLLRLSAEGEIRMADAVQSLAEEFALTEEERTQLLPSGRQTTFANRVHWAKAYLSRAGLVETTKRAHFRITDEGRRVLADPPERITVRYLMRYPGVVAFRRNAQAAAPAAAEDLSDTIATPDEELRAAHAKIETALRADLLERVLAAPPAFFESLIVRVLLAMGYGGSNEEAGRALGRSGDGGVDGVIDQDTLGLDRVYIQAKRYRPETSISPSQIRDFFGSLDAFRASKGVFVTTSSFSKAAQEAADRMSKRIVLINGEQLTALMLRFNVGLRIQETFHLKQIDEDFFDVE
jgi:restriction system protein